MKIKELVQLVSRAMTISCFEEYTNTYSDYIKEKEKLDDKEVSMIECTNGEEINIYYKNKSTVEKVLMNLGISK